MTELIIRLNKSNAVVTDVPEGINGATGEAIPAHEIIDWTPALVAAATEVQMLNAYSGTESFPRPIPCNPESDQAEGFLGLVNTPPDESGFVTVRIDYEYLDLGLLPAQPQTFTFVFGRPQTAGMIA